MTANIRKKELTRDQVSPNGNTYHHTEGSLKKKVEAEFVQFTENTEDKRTYEMKPQEQNQPNTGCDKLQK